MDALHPSGGGIQGVPDLNEGRPMYQKARVYNGVHEFSFEELRAAQVMKLKKEKEKEGISH